MRYRRTWRQCCRRATAELLRFGYKYIKMVLLIEDALQMKEEMKTLPEPPDL